MAEPIRAAILSFAHYHANFWSQAFLDSPLAEFVGIWDDDIDRGAQAAGRFGVRFWADLGELLKACEAVGICSETVKHADLVEEAVRNQCHVLCEKPLATTLDDCRRITDAVRRGGITFMQSFPKRFDPVNHELLRLVREEELGRTVFARIRHGHLYGLGPDYAKEWAADPVLAGAGTLLDEGIHGADLLRWLFGEPESVTAMVSNAALGLGVDDVGVAVYRFPNGMLAELSSSVAFAAAENSVEIYGLRGSAVLSGVDLASRDVTDRGFLKICKLGEAERRWTVSPLVPGFQTTPRFHQQNPLEFLDALSKGTPPPNTVEDGHRAVEMILAAYRSARSGKVEKISPA